MGPFRDPMGGTAAGDNTGKPDQYVADVFEKGDHFTTLGAYEIRILCTRVRERAIFRDPRGRRR